MVALSPDGSKLYVGGDFTVAGGKQRTRLVAIDTATGEVDVTFRPEVDAAVKTMVVTNSVVYLGGSFTTVNGQPRSRLAAVTAKRGILLDWNPSADDSVYSMVRTPGGSEVVVGGRSTIWARFKRKAWPRSA